RQILLFYIALTLVAIGLFAPEKTGAEMLFILSPVAIVTSNYFVKNKNEKCQEKDKFEWIFKELLLCLIVFFSLISFFLCPILNSKDCNKNLKNVTIFRTGGLENKMTNGMLFQILSIKQKPGKSFKIKSSLYPKPDNCLKRNFFNML